jgi:hypothetical protein
MMIVFKQYNNENVVKLGMTNISLNEIFMVEIFASLKFNQKQIIFRHHQLSDWGGHQRCRRDHNCGQSQQFQPLCLLARWSTYQRT